MLHGVPPTIRNTSLQVCHKFKMFQRISFKKQFMPFSQLVTDSINIIMPGDGKEWDVSTSVRFIFANFFIRVQFWIQKRPDLESIASSPINLSWVDPPPSISACKRASWTPSRSFLRLLWVDEEARGRPAARSANFLDEKLSSAWIVSEHLHNLPPSTAL